MNTAPILQLWLELSASFLVYNPLKSHTEWTPRDEYLRNRDSIEERFPFQELGFRGFRVLGFPSDQFAGQELETNQQIKTFARETYSVNFDMFAKINVS